MISPIDFVKFIIVRTSILSYSDAINGGAVNDGKGLTKSKLTVFYIFFIVENKF